MPELHDIFRALGDPTRLAIFQLLRTCPPDLAIDESGGCHRVAGASVGDVCCRVNVGQSTVSHHLKELRHAGLVRMERRGRTVFCSVAQDALDAIRAFAEQAPAAGDAADMLT